MDISDPVVKSFLLYGTTVLSKTMVMSLLTGATRMRKQVFSSEEDVKAFGGVVKRDDSCIERIRRCHLNDMENVYPFVLLGAFYCATRPSYSTAVLHFRIFTIARILHTIIYLKKVPQPARALAFAAGLGVCVSMAYRIVAAVWK